MHEIRRKYSPLVVTKTADIQSFSTALPGSYSASLLHPENDMSSHSGICIEEHEQKEWVVSKVPWAVVGTGVRNTTRLEAWY